MTLTHHHIQRLYHMSLGTCFLFAAMVVAYGFGLMIFQASADPLSQSYAIGMSAGVPEINPEPTVTLGSGGIGSPPPNNQSAPPQTPQAPAVEIVPTEQPQPVMVDGHLEQRPVYASQQPTFAGKSSIKNGIVFIEVHSDYILRATTYTTATGEWAWQVPEAISPGPHTMFVTIQDPNIPELSVKTSFDFYIQLPSGSVPVTFTPRPPPASPANSNNLFDVIVRVPDAYKKIAPGTDLVAIVKLINFGAPGHPVDVTVEYDVKGPEGQSIVTVSETLAVATQISLLKTFHTASTVHPGQYTITAKVPSKGVIAVASDSFEINGSAVIPLTSKGVLDYTFVFQALFGLLLLFSLITYFEYRRVVMLSRAMRQVSESDVLASRI